MYRKSKTKNNSSHKIVSLLNNPKLVKIKNNQNQHKKTNKKYCLCVFCTVTLTTLIYARTQTNL